MKYGITQEDLKKLVHYDPETGLFKRIGSFHKNSMHKHCGSMGSRGYLQLSVKNRQHPQHRLAWFYMHGVWPEADVDHIDGDRTNNRISNLRCATRSENHQNIRGANKSSHTGILGVSYIKSSGMWKAKITLNYKVYRLGHFETAELASAAYMKAKRELHPFGEIAKKGVIYQNGTPQTEECTA